MPSLPLSAGIFLFEHRKFKSSRYPAFSDHPLKPCGIWERIAKSLAQTAGCLESHSQQNGNKLTSQVEKIEHWFKSFIIYSFMKKKNYLCLSCSWNFTPLKIKQKIHLLSFHWQKQIQNIQTHSYYIFPIFPLVTAHNGNASAQLCIHFIFLIIAMYAMVGLNLFLEKKQILSKPVILHDSFVKKASTQSIHFAFYF